MEAAMLLRLGVEERLSLLQALWESLHDELQARTDLSPTTAAELDRRLEDHRREPHDAMTLDEFTAQVRDRR